MTEMQRNSSTSDDHTGRCYLITGAGSGIGRAVALRVAAAGAGVALADKDFRGASAVASDIVAAGGTAVALKVDISDEAQVQQMILDAVAEFGALHGAFNNAGIAAAGDYAFGTPLTDIEATDFRAMIEVNTTGLFLCLKHELRVMRQAGTSIVNTASAAGLIGMPQGAPYVASKHAAVGLTKAAALEAAPRDVRVNSICPGYTETPMLLANATTTGRQRRVDSTPLGRLGQPEEIAEIAAWLLSPASSFMTGSNIAIDGGLTAGGSTIGAG
ncbi:SDR family NAD(P)-dependent oxidoreductase [Gordonia humi]|uniref:NAD(P)-dependent dehydrogenase (Short-subunit alcohol dehydrogenase family) n=1 Tax=Gordonia humi TaxID=686429 RepID=A0A840F6U3_9ACTN|nr:SDR family NAD(P)-dependent oxidoreductase [Gordonia humi]MBB4138128.1 NAD(P)-dependent dehydrogenase (short-subunit alcohol dehydrogenase family) [Gordonia humi]